MDDQNPLAPLLQDGVIDEVLGRLKSGKEADLWLVRRQDVVIAAKVYKDRDRRSFKNNAEYKEGREVRNSRTRRAIESGSRFGKEAEEQEWKSAEADALALLHESGVRVPVPVVFYEGVLLMQLVLDAEGEPALRLIDVPDLGRTAVALYKDLRTQIVRMLCCDIIHGDLSAYNILAGAGGPTIIDFPQIVAASANSRAEFFFQRDFENVLQFLASADRALLQYRDDGKKIWNAYTRRDLTPDFVPSPPGVGVGSGVPRGQQGERGQGRGPDRGPQQQGRGPGPGPQQGGRPPRNMPQPSWDKGPRPVPQEPRGPRPPNPNQRQPNSSRGRQPNPNRPPQSQPNRQPQPDQQPQPDPQPQPQPQQQPQPHPNPDPNRRPNPNHGRGPQRHRDPRPQGQPRQDRAPRPPGQPKDRGPRPQGQPQDRGPRSHGQPQDRGPRPQGQPQDRGPRPPGQPRGPRPDGRPQGQPGQTPRGPKPPKAPKGPKLPSWLPRGGGSRSGPPIAAHPDSKKPFRKRKRRF